MADIIPPSPVDAPFGSYNWQDWFKKVRIAINSATNLAWNQITDFTGSNLNQIQTRLHNSLQSIQGGNGSTEYYHFTAAEHMILITNVSGIYTPTITAVANNTISSSDSTQWMRIGNIIQCVGRADINITALATTTTFDVQLPVASNFATTSDAHGVMGTATITQVGVVFASAATDSARIQFISATTGASSVWYSFQYTVI